jgi:hypothetical protein
MAYIVITNKSSFYNSGWACLGLDGKRSFFQGSLKSSYDVFKLIAKSGCCDYTRFLFPTFFIFFSSINSALHLIGAKFRYSRRGLPLLKLCVTSNHGC